MKRILGVLFLLVLMPFAAEAREYTLEQAVAQALKANPGLAAKLQAIKVSQMNIGVAQSYFWPKVSLYAGKDRLRNAGDVGSVDELSNKTGRRGVDVTLSLFAGFMHLNELERSMMQADVSRAQHEQAEIDLVANVQTQFLGLLSARSERTHIRDAIARIQTQLKAAEAFVRLDMAPRLNVLQNEVELSQARQEEIRVNNDIRHCVMQLNRLLGLPPGEQVLYAGDLWQYGGAVGYTEEEALARAMRSRPDLVVARKSIDVALKEADISAGSALPRVDLVYSDGKMKRDYRDERFDDYTRRFQSVRLTVTWDVFEGGKTAFSYLGDKKRARALTMEYEDALNKAGTEVSKSLMDIAAAWELIGMSRRGVEAAKESYAMADKRYGTQIGTITELLDAQAKLTRAETEATRAWAEYHRARVLFFHSIGTYNAALN